MKPDISIVIPAYNEQFRIENTLQEIQRFFQNSELIVELIVVDDGSTDRTVEVVTSFIDSIPYVKIIKIPINMGKGYAVRKGMLNAQGMMRLYMDADNSVSISTIDYFIQELKKGYGIVIGSIGVKGSSIHENNGAIRYYLNKISKIPVRYIATPNIYDTQRGFKLFSEEAVNKIFPLQTIEKFGFDIELIVIAQVQGIFISELPISWNNPIGSKVNLADYLKTFRELLKIVSNKWLGKYGKRDVDTEKVVMHFNLEDRLQKGKGFYYNGKEFTHHSDLHHTSTALYVLHYSHKVLLSVLALLLILFLFINWHSTIVIIFAVLTIFYFADLILYAVLVWRAFRKLPEIKISTSELEEVDSASLPTYTIFCPLYKEWRVIPQFVKAMENLDYPEDKLSVMLLLEEDDTESLLAAQKLNLPEHFSIVVVPHSFPKTKPKAMNFGLLNVKSEYVVVFDAEDIPEPDQLIKAAIAFKKLPKEIICIQAKLSFYNAKQNILTRIFTAEYALWFDLILPGLQSFNAPIPLGGTSNHFKVSSLKDLYGWDAFNVTEDCDLGLRLAKNDFKTAIIDSTTYEEANSQVINWYNQRSRWIKGYIQTYLVHMRSPEVSSKRKILDFLAIQVIIGGKIFSIFINPFLWLITICYFLFRAHIGLFIQSFFPDPILYIGVASLLFGNFLYLYYYMIGCAKRGDNHLIKFAFLVPLYWLAMSFSAWKGLYELVVKPHYWSKTVHGLHLASAKRNVKTT